MGTRRDICHDIKLHFSGLKEGWDLVNQFNHPSWVAVITPTDRPKSVRYCFIKFWRRFRVLDFSVGVGIFVTGLNKISSFFNNYTQ